MFSCHNHLHLPCSSVTVTSTYHVLVSQLHQHTLFSCLPLPCSHVVNLSCFHVLSTSMHLPCSRVVRLSLSRPALNLFSYRPHILTSYQSHVKCTYPVLAIVSSAYPYLVSQSRQCTYLVLVSSAYPYLVSVTYPVLMSSAYPYLVSQSRPAPTLFSCPHRVQPTPQVKVGELLSPAVYHLVPLGRHPQPQAVEVAAAGSHAHHQRGGHTDRQAQCHLAGGTTSLTQDR